MEARSRPLESDLLALLAPKVRPAGRRSIPSKSGPPAAGTSEAATRFEPEIPKSPKLAGIWRFQKILESLKKLGGGQATDPFETRS